MPSAETCICGFSVGVFTVIVKVVNMSFNVKSFEKVLYAFLISVLLILNIILTVMVFGKTIFLSLAYYIL